MIQFNQFLHLSIIIKIITIIINQYKFEIVLCRNSLIQYSG
jgi:hypothetical protein